MAGCQSDEEKNVPPQEVRKDWIEDKAIEPWPLEKKREGLGSHRGQGGE